MPEKNLDSSRAVTAGLVLLLLLCTPLAVGGTLDERRSTIVQYVLALCFVAVIAFQLRSPKQIRKVVQFPLSIFWAPVLLVIGWGPLAVADLIVKREDLMGFGMAWGLLLAVPALFISGGLILFDVIWFFSSWFSKGANNRSVS